MRLWIGLFFAATPCLLVAGGAGPVAAAPAASVPGYTIFEFGMFLPPGVWSPPGYRGAYVPGEAYDINNQDQVVGVSGAPFLWQAETGMQTLPIGPAAINDIGQIAGSTRIADQSHTAVWQAGKGVQDLGVLPGDTDSTATGINDRGQVVGLSTSTGLWSNLGGRAFLWEPGRGMQDLGTLGGSSSAANGINDNGQVVGWSEVAGGERHAFQWQPGGGMQDLGLGFATDINDRGQVVGTAISNGDMAFLWQAGTGMQDLGFVPGDTDSRARAINDRGQIVG